MVATISRIDAALSMKASAPAATACALTGSRAQIARDGLGLPSASGSA